MSPSELERKRLFMINLAADICKSGRESIHVMDLASRLNEEGITTNDGKKFKGLRGTHQLLRAVVVWLREQRDRAERWTEEEDIRHAFLPSPWQIGAAPYGPASRLRKKK
ncbi:MAG TPA: hypothetical protein VHW45_20105 [Candidatus Sulfotelmatobacter sp.]|jgi:hypothetical protein|nr:hypothetical protein [Candidatus Sulfotelmatobacter sp.]